LAVPLFHVIVADEMGFLRPLETLTGQDKQIEKHKCHSRLQENNWKCHVAKMETILCQYWLSVMIRAIA
jgi:hypothetical protein